MRFEFGPGGSKVVEAEVGDFVRVPKHTVHRENNPPATEGRLVVLRFASGAPNFNVEGPAKRWARRRRRVVGSLGSTVAGHSKTK